MFALICLAAVVAEPAFTQRVEAEFASTELAAKAELAVCEMPAGKKYAFSTRCDDANPRHDRMSETLSAIGVPSTFYVNGKPDAAFVAVMSNVLARGSSIGAHTIHHSLLSRLSSMRVFREVMESRIVLEIASQSPVTTFTLPYSSIGTRADPESAHRAGRALANAGFLGGAERNTRQFATYGLPAERWVSSDTFSIDDKNPNEEMFTRQFAAAKARIDAGNCPSGPHLTLGVHAWQSDEGMRRLADIVRPVSGRADTWYCNENEYVAHRIQRFAAKIEKESACGRRAVWRVERPEPHVLGAAVPFAGVFSADPVAVRIDGRPVAAAREVSLPVPSARALPVAYRMVGGGVVLEDGLVRTEFANKTGAPLDDVVLTLRLPPCCEPGTVTRAVGRVGAGETVSQTWKFARTDSAEPDDGEFFCAVQTDAIGKDGRIRFWQSAARATRTAALDCPRDRCRVAGPFPAAPVDELVRAAEGKWRPAKREDGAAAYAISALGALKPKAGEFVLFAFDFDADVARHGDRWKIRAEIPLFLQKSSFLLNGVVTDVREPVRLRPAGNRLVVAVPAEPGNWGCRMMMSVVSLRDGAGVSYHEAESRRPLLVLHLDFNTIQMRKSCVVDCLRTAARSGYTAVLWEIENKVRWETCPECVHPEAFTKDEFREILAEARRLRLEPIPLLQTFGHAEYVLMNGRHPEWMEDPGFPACYCVSKPEVRVFLRRMIGEYLELFGPDVRRFHLGGDEAKAFCRCPVCSKRKRMELYAEHLQAVAEPLFQKGISPGIWCDMVLGDAEAFRSVGLPKAFSVWHWDYVYDGRGNRREWTDRMDVLRELGHDVVFCVSSSSSGDGPFLPRYGAHMDNVAAAAELFRRERLLGLCMTSWSVRKFPKVLQYPIWHFAAKRTIDPSPDRGQDENDAYARFLGPQETAVLRGLTEWEKHFCSYDATGWWTYIKDASPAPAGTFDKVMERETSWNPRYREELVAKARQVEANMCAGLSRMRPADTPIAAVLTNGVGLAMSFARTLCAVCEGTRSPDVPRTATCAYYLQEQTPLSATNSADVTWSVLR